MITDSDIRELERVPIFCPLGIRFWDPVLRRPVVGGLRVTATPSGRDFPVLEALLNSGDVYAFHALPGLRDAILGAVADHFSGSPSPRRLFVVEVTDLERRFLPFRWELEAPVRGLYRPPFWDSPSVSPVDAVVLFPSPARDVPAGMAVVRADLRSADNRAPLPWALVSVRTETPGGTVVCQGMSDAEGRVAVFLPWPELPAPPVADSPPDQGLALRDRNWPLDVQVATSRLPADDPPDLRLVSAQPLGTPLSELSPAVPLPLQTLQFGRELILRSIDPETLQSAANLFVQPAV